LYPTVRLNRLNILDKINKKLKKMKKEKFSFKNIKDVLSRDEMKKIVAGSGNLEYCATSYMIRSCNSLSGGAYAGWQSGWSQGGCSQYGGAALWGAAPSNMSGCNTSWYSY
jgi:hypothetical protein